MVNGLFIFSRLPFFLYYPLPITAPDTATYFWQLEKMEQGMWPTFEFRTPGYPFFWWLCRRISYNILFVIYAQSALTLFCINLILLLLRKYSHQYIVPAAFSLAVHMSSPMHLAMDMFLLTESVFVNYMLLFFLFLYLALHSRNVIFAVLSSVMATAVLYTRPNGAFLIPILALSIFYVWWHQYGRKVLLGFVTPVAVGLIGLSSYNAATNGFFGLSGGQEWAMLWSTAIYLEPDAGLPDEINQAIEAKSAKISNVHKEIIFHSWDLNSFRRIIEHNIWDAIVPIASITGGPGLTPKSYLDQRGLMRKIYWTAIQQHPEVYFKNFLGTFIEYFMMIRTTAWGDFYSYFPAEQYRATFVDRAFYVEGLKDYYNPKLPPQFRVIDSTDGIKQVIANPHKLTSWYSKYTKIRAKVFENIFWIVPIIIGISVSLYQLLRRRYITIDNFFVLLMIFCLICHALISALIGHVEERYSYTLEFVNYLLFPVLPIALSASKQCKV